MPTGKIRLPTAIAHAQSRLAPIDDSIGIVLRKGNQVKLLDHGFQHSRGPQQLL
jgi:hypothetical protein